MILSAIIPPNPKCIVCSPKPEVIIKIDTNTVTIKQFRDDVLIKALNMIEPDVTDDNKGVILISSEEGETDCNNDKTLSEMDVKDGAILKVDDFFQNYELTVIIVHKEPDREGALFDIVADPDTLKADNQKTKEPVAAASANDDKNGVSPSKKPRIENAENNDNASGSNGNKQIANDSDDDICIIEDDAMDTEASVSGESSESKKRKTADILGEPSSKRTKIISQPNHDDDDLILIDDD